MAERDQMSRREAADLAGLADGTLEGRRLRRAQKRVDADSALAADVERQRAARDAVRATAATVEAPPALRARIEAMTQASAVLAAPARRPRAGRPRLAIAAGLAAVATTALVLAGGGGGLSVDETLAAAARPAAIGVSLDPQEPRLLNADVEGVPFPNPAAKLGWQATGQRSDELGGRDTRTVFYTKDGREIAYSIVAGEALDEPERGRAATRMGVRVRTFEHDGRTVVTWQRGGHTCVLSGEGVRTDDLLEFAAWKGKGAVPF